MPSTLLLLLLLLLRDRISEPRYSMQFWKVGPGAIEVPRVSGMLKEGSAESAAPGLGGGTCRERERQQHQSRAVRRTDKRPG